LLLKFESTPVALNAHVRQARALAGGATCEVVAAQSEADLWRAHLRSPAVAGNDRQVRVDARLARAVLALVDDLRASVTGIELTGRAAIGSGLLRVDADPRVQRNVVERLRSRTDVFRHVVVLRADAAVKQQLDVWDRSGCGRPRRVRETRPRSARDPERRPRASVNHDARDVHEGSHAFSGTDQPRWRSSTPASIAASAFPRVPPICSGTKRWTRRAAAST